MLDAVYFIRECKGVDTIVKGKKLQKKGKRDTIKNMVKSMVDTNILFGDCHRLS